jgi:hypothetical protein
MLPLNLHNFLLSIFPAKISRYTYWNQEEPKKNIRTIQKRVSRHYLLGMWASNTDFVGLPLGEKTRYLILDIDAGSPYRTTADIQRIQAVFEKRGIDLIPCRSSRYSGGLHLLAIFKKPVLSRKIARLASDLLQAHRSPGTGEYFRVSPGWLEVYPSVISPNQAVRLPFQQGFALVQDEIGIPMRLEINQNCHSSYGPIVQTRWEEDLGLEVRWESDDPIARAEKFKWLAENRFSEVNDWRLPTKKHLVQKKGRKAANQTRYNLGQRLFEQGLDGSINRHDALKKISYYLVLEGYTCDDRIQMMSRWMETKHNDYADDWLRNPREVLQDIKRMCHWSPKTSSQGNMAHSRFGAYNQHRHEEKLPKLLRMVDALLDHGTLFLRNGRMNQTAIHLASGLSRDFIRDNIEHVNTRVASYRSHNAVEIRGRFYLISCKLAANGSVSKARKSWPKPKNIVEAMVHFRLSQVKLNAEKPVTRPFPEKSIRLNYLNAWSRKVM